MTRHRETIARNCQVVREDFGICETSQGNLEAGIFQRGPLSPRHEEGVRHFHDLLRQSLDRAA
jgi:choline monooxygenase